MSGRGSSNGEGGRTDSPREMFDGRVHCQIPAFQRPYVRSEDNQWRPLWQNATPVATKVIVVGQDPEDMAHTARHRMGGWNVDAG